MHKVWRSLVSTLSVNAAILAESAFIDSTDTNLPETLDRSFDEELSSQWDHSREDMHGDHIGRRSGDNQFFRGATSNHDGGTRSRLKDRHVNNSGQLRDRSFFDQNVRVAEFSALVKDQRSKNTTDDLEELERMQTEKIVKAGVDQRCKETEDRTGKDKLASEKLKLQKIEGAVKKIREGEERNRKKLKERLEELAKDYRARAKAKEQRDQEEREKRRKKERDDLERLNAEKAKKDQDAERKKDQEEKDKKAHDDARMREKVGWEREEREKQENEVRDDQHLNEAKLKKTDLNSSATSTVKKKDFVLKMKQRNVKETRSNEQLWKTKCAREKSVKAKKAKAKKMKQKQAKLNKAKEKKAKAKIAKAKKLKAEMAKAKKAKAKKAKWNKQAFAKTKKEKYAKEKKAKAKKAKGKMAFAKMMKEKMVKEKMVKEKMVKEKIVKEKIMNGKGRKTEGKKGCEKERKKRGRENMVRETIVREKKESEQKASENMERDVMEKRENEQKEKERKQRETKEKEEREKTEQEEKETWEKQEYEKKEREKKEKDVKEKLSREKEEKEKKDEEKKRKDALSLEKEKKEREETEEREKKEKEMEKAKKNVDQKAKVDSEIAKKLTEDVEKAAGESLEKGKNKLENLMKQVEEEERRADLEKAREERDLQHRKRLDEEKAKQKEAINKMANEQQEKENRQRKEDLEKLRSEIKEKKEKEAKDKLDQFISCGQENRERAKADPRGKLSFDEARQLAEVMGYSPNPDELARVDVEREGWESEEMEADRRPSVDTTAPVVCAPEVPSTMISQSSELTSDSATGESVDSSIARPAYKRRGTDHSAGNVTPTRRKEAAEMLQPSGNLSDATAVFRTMVMDEVRRAQNFYRCIHGSPPLRWSVELSSAAQRWADHTEGTLRPSPDGVRKNIFGCGEVGVGENIAKGVPADAAVDVWYDEIMHSADGLGRLEGYNQDMTHYSQLVWKDTKTVGCGVRGDLTVCWYGCAGNQPSGYLSNVMGVQDLRDADFCQSG